MQIWLKGWRFWSLSNPVRCWVIGQDTQPCTGYTLYDSSQQLLCESWCEWVNRRPWWGALALSISDPPRFFLTRAINLCNSSPPRSGGFLGLLSSQNDNQWVCLRLETLLNLPHICIFYSLFALQLSIFFFVVVDRLFFFYYSKVFAITIQFFFLNFKFYNVFLSAATVLFPNLGSIMYYLF